MNAESLQSQRASDLEKKIIGLWATLLPGIDIGVHDDFFDLGGHSLLLLEMLIALRDVVSEDVPVDHFLERPTISYLVEFALSLPAGR